MDGYEYMVSGGRLSRVSQSGEVLSQLISSNYTYRVIHTVGHRPLHLATQLKLLDYSSKGLYGMQLNPDPGTIEKNIRELLYRNNAPQGGNTVMITARPHDVSGEPITDIFYEGPLVYAGYSIWHKPVKALPLTYEIPFPAFKTAANRLCHSFARRSAALKGYGEVISVNYRDEAVSAGENPLFAISGRTVYTPETQTSSPQSAERMLGLQLCEMAGLTPVEGTLTAESLAEMDELFSFTPQGVLPVGAIKKHLYPSTLVKTFADFLPALESLEFL